MKTLKQLEDEIRLVAHQLYELGGKLPGNEEEDWLEAERIVMSRYIKEDQNREDKQLQAGFGYSHESAESPGPQPAASKRVKPGEGQRRGHGSRTGKTGKTEKTGKKIK